MLNVRLSRIGASRRALVLAAATLALAGAFAAAATAAAAISPRAQGHPYRHGVVPLRPGAHHRGHNTIQAAASGGLLAYGGGVSGVGVVTGPPRVYLVFWGSQWGTQSTNSQGYVTLSGDPNNAAPDLQGFFKGLGTGGELWSGVMTQYCDASTTGATSCPASNTQHTGYPTGGALAGVWVDESRAEPASANGNQIGTEAVAAAAHFGNTTQASNLNVQYDIVSPTGTTPDGFNTSGGSFCAWHDYTGDSTLTGGAVSSPYGSIAFTNMPYVSDAGTGCGQNFVNSGSAGTDDGFTIVNGHEFAETVTDEYPAGGWTDSSGNENGDKCAWIAPGTTGGSQNITLTTGTFAVQTTWANDDGSSGGCEASHPIVTNPGTGNTVTVTNPGSQTSTVGTAASLQMSASDSASGQTLTYGATGLPAGLSISSSTGLISGTPTTAGSSSVTVTATDTTGASGSTSFTWTVNASGGGGCTAAQLLGNPGFETGTAAPWTASSGVINNSTSEPPHSGTWDAWLDGYGTVHTDTVSQTVTIPAGCTSDTLSFWLHIDTANTSGQAQDTLAVQLLNSSGTVLTTLATYSNLNATTGDAQKTLTVPGQYAGQAVTLKLTGTESGNGQTSFVVDDFAFNVAGGSGGGNTVTVTNPGSQTGTVGTAASLQISASDSASGQTLTYSATGLPAGLSISSSTGLISGTPTTAGTSSVTVTVKDGTGASGTTSFSWTINTSGGDVITVTNPGNQTGTVGTAASLQINASDSASGQTLTYSATGLPAGLSISSSTGLISGTPTTAGTSSVTVNVTDPTRAHGSTTFSWSVSAVSGCGSQQLLADPGFEQGTSQTAWSVSTGVLNNSSGEPPHSGSWNAWLDGYGTTHTDTLAQTVTIPSNCAAATFSFWLHVDTAETSTTTNYDTLKVQVLNSSGTVLATLHTYGNLDHNTGYAQHSFSLTPYLGQKVTLKFTGSEDYELQTSFVIDDTALNVS